MFNKYTIEVFEDNKQVKAKIYLDNDCLGTIWSPTKTLKKEEFKQLFESVGNVIYGQEKKAEAQEESYSKVVKAIEAKDKREQETLQEEGC